MTGKKILEFQLRVEVPGDAKYVAVDPDGQIVASPNLISSNDIPHEGWWEPAYPPKVRCCNTEPRVLNWRETLVKFDD